MLSSLRSLLFVFCVAEAISAVQEVHDEKISAIDGASKGDQFSNKIILFLSYGRHEGSGKLMIAYDNWSKALVLID